MTMYTIDPAIRTARAPAVLDVARSFLKRDLAEIWPGLAALLLLAVTVMWSGKEFGFAVDMFLMVLVGRWILSDPPSDPNALWRTLPVRPGTLLAVKLGAVFLLVVVPLVTMQAIQAARLGVTGAELIGVLADALIYASTLVIASAAVAAHSRDFPQFVLRGAVILIAVTVGGFLIVQQVIRLDGPHFWFRPPWFETAMFLASLPFFAAAAWAGASRRGGRASWSLLVIGLGIVGIVRPAAWALTVRDESAGAPRIEDARVEIALVSLRNGPTTMTKMRGWPTGVPAGIFAGGPSDVLHVSVRGIDGALRLKNGRTIPVSKALSRSSDVNTVTLTGDTRPLRVVQLFDLAPDQAAKLANEPGRLELDVRYQTIRHAVVPYDRHFRLLGVNRLPRSIHAEIEQVAIPSQGRSLIQNCDLALWDETHTRGFRLTHTGAGIESPRVGVLSHPEMRTAITRMDFDLDSAKRLPQGDAAGDASQIITESWLAHAKVEILATFWDPIQERRIVVPDFRIADWRLPAE
jgi:hypothetical protein